MEAELEQRRELEEEAAEGGGEFDLQRRQPRQHNNGSTTAVTINGMSTTASLSSSSSSEYSLGADLISQLVEEGEFSFESFALTSGEVNFNDSNNKSTTPGTVMVDIATESFGIETIDELSKSTDPPPSNKNSSIQEQIAGETSIDIGAIEQEGRVRIDIREEIEEQKETTDLYLETVYKKPATSDFYCPNCQACIDKVLIRSRLEEEELRCPSCFAFLKPLGDWFFRKPVPTQVPESRLPRWRGTQPKEQTPHPQKSHVPINTIIQGNKEPAYQLKPGDTVLPPPSSTLEVRTPTALQINKEPTYQLKPEDTVHPTPSSTLEAWTPTAVTGEILERNKDPSYQSKPGDTVRPPPSSTLEARTPTAVTVEILEINKEPTYQLKPEDTVHPTPSSTLEAWTPTAVTGEILERNKDPSYQSKPGDTVHPTPSSTLEARTPTAVTVEILEINKEPTYQLKPEDTVHPTPSSTLETWTPTAVTGEILERNKEPSYQSKPGDTFHPTPSSTLEAQTPTAVTGEILEGNKEPTYQLKPGDTLRPPLPLTAQSTPEQDGTIKLEIVKSLVYGGLTESIASLSVVTSAASAAASTLSILVLALANLIGGLFIIGHNLRDLKNDQSRVNLNEAEEQVDRYLQVLGQKKNFIIHASVAVLSFLVFGLVPPVVYGFSFYKSDNSYLKLAVVAAASLISITILAIAKAYIKKPTRWYMYLRTVTYYVSLGVGASGISYLAGYLFKLLIDKLGWFESSAAVTLSLPGMSSVPSAQVSSY